MYGKMLIIQFSYNFKKTIEKKFNQIQQSGDEK